MADEMMRQRLTSLEGTDGRCDDVFVCGDANANQHVLFFGGDVQDYKENMEQHRDNKRYTEWNTEDTALLIQSKFPKSLVVVIRPSRMHLKTFALYSNFVEVNDFGCPEHSTDFGAIKHLYCLYKSITKELSLPIKQLSDKPLHIIGFSRGCVVLNQIACELPSLSSEGDTEQLTFLSRVKSFHWLDGGHSGSKDTWITQEPALRHLAKLGAEIHIHVTPYQIQNPCKKWVGEQQAKFYKRLKRFEAQVNQTVHFDAVPASLENHFLVLKEF